MLWGKRIGNCLGIGCYLHDYADGLRNGPSAFYGFAYSGQIFAGMDADTKT